MKRGEKRPKKIFALYPIQTEPEMTERRFPAKVPQENIRHRILVQCNKLEYVPISFLCFLLLRYTWGFVTVRSKIDSSRYPTHDPTVVMKLCWKFDSLKGLILLR